jgi:hypothetical protein
MAMGSKFLLLLVEHALSNLAIHPCVLLEDMAFSGHRTASQSVLICSSPKRRLEETATRVLHTFSLKPHPQKGRTVIRQACGL